MERFWCCLAGFAIALALVAGFLIVKEVVEDKKSAREQRMRLIAREECRDLKKNIYWHNIIGIEKYVDVLVDKRLAEKEGENETD